MRRPFLARRALGLAVALAGTMMPAMAQNYPWCVQYGGRGDGAMNCGFVSFEQCMQTAQGAGGFCIVNNRYVPPSQSATPAHHVHKRHSHKSS